MGLLLYPSQAVCGGDCWTQDLWQVLCPKGPLPAKPAGEMLLKTTWKSALFPQSCLQRNKQTKNTFRGKWGLLVLTTGVAENWMEKSSPQFCHIPHRHCHKNTPTPLSFSVMKTCAEIALGSYIFVFFLSSLKCVQVLISVIGYWRCIPLLITGMSEYHITDNVFLSSYLHHPPFTLISANASSCCSAVND